MALQCAVIAYCSRLRLLRLRLKKTDFENFINMNGSFSSYFRPTWYLYPVSLRTVPGSLPYHHTNAFVTILINHKR